MQVMNHPRKNLSNRRNSLFHYPREEKKRKKKKKKGDEECPQTMEFCSVKNFHRVALILSNYTTLLPAPVIFRNITESRGESRQDTMVARQIVFRMEKGKTCSTRKETEGTCFR